MGKLKGQNEYKRFLQGDNLSPKKAILAHCFMCNGEIDGSGEDCRGKSCPLYSYFKKWMWNRKIAVALNVETEKATL